jgi:hypothetical protein
MTWLGIRKRTREGIRARQEARKLLTVLPAPKPAARPEADLENRAKWFEEHRPFSEGVTGQLMVHDAMMRAQGLDPNIIGATEVPPVLCPCCKAPIPWSLIVR